MVLCKGFLILSVFVMAAFGGPNSSAEISLDMNQDLDGNQKYFISNREKDTFTVAVRVSEFNDQKNLNYFTVRMKIDSSKYTFVSSSFNTENEENILGTNLQSPGQIITDSTIEIGAALMSPPYSDKTKGLLGIFNFVAKTRYNDSIKVVIEEVSLCIPGPECDYFNKPDSGIFVAKPTYIMNVTQIGSGITFPNGDTLITCGDTVDLKAVPDDNWKFIKWEVADGNAEIIDKTAEQTQLIASDEDVVVTAEFDVISKAGNGFDKRNSGFDLIFKNGKLLFRIPSGQSVSFSIFDIQGKVISQFFPGTVSCGYNSIRIGKGMLPNGLLFCRMQTKNRQKTIPLNFLE